MDRSAAEQAGREWLERLGLADRAKDKLASLSKGNQQKVQFAAAVLHHPAFAVLDEPFAGLDPVNQELFLHLIKELQDGGTTVLLSAHQMSLIERLANRVLLMNRGREVLSGTLDEIRRRTDSPGRLRLSVQGPTDLQMIQGLPGVQEATQADGEEVVVRYRADASLSDILAALGSRLNITGVLSEQASLHDIYVQAVGSDAQPDANQPESRGNEE
jgi:ABC-2 type transport system ATP-binding protein